MSEEQLKAFLLKAKADESLQEQLKSAADAHEILAIAKDSGFVITAARAEEMHKSMNPADKELSDDELENVAGGAHFLDPLGAWLPWNWF